MDHTCPSQFQSNCIMNLEKLNMVQKELTCQILAELRKMLKEQEKEHERV
jgi:hypothetical protein